MLTEVLAPQLERPAFPDSDFEHSEGSLQLAGTTFCSDVTEYFVVDFEVMPPLRKNFISVGSGELFKSSAFLRDLCVSTSKSDL
jgi:hypothetical protein